MKSSRLSSGRLARPPTTAIPLHRLGGSNARTGRHFLTYKRHEVSAHEEDINPPRLERGDTGGSTRMRDQLHAPVAEQTEGIRLLNGTTQVQVLPGAVISFPVMFK